MTLAQAIIYDLAANRPSAGTPGRLFYASDTNVLSRDNGSTWDTLSTGGGTGTVTHTGTLTANVPIIGNSGADVTVGSASGNTTKFVTQSGSVTSGHLMVADASGNAVDGGAPGSGGFTTRTDKSSNSLNTAYQNTSGAPIFVTITAINNAGSSKSLFVYSNASNPPTTDYVSFVTASVSFATTACFWVMNNHYYIVKQDSGGNFGVQTWWEYS